MTVTIANVAETVAADIKAFRSASVTSENRANVSARSMLAALVSGLWTRSLAESAIIHAFGNPKSPKSGKPVAKLSGLRDFTGGDAVRKAAETCFRIFENIDTDKPVTVASDTDGQPDTIVGAGAIRPLIVSYILNETDAPKSLRALNEAVAAALRAHAKAISPDNSEAETETAAETADATAPATVSLVDRINALTVALSAADDETLSGAYDAMEALVAAYDTRVNAATDASAPEVLAA